MSKLPQLVSHRYDPEVGVCPNLCNLPQAVADTVLQRLRSGSRPRLKPDYLTRRHATEAWLCQAASELLGRPMLERPAYFFLGDFSHGLDESRPATLTLPLSALPDNAITFTLGDSMRVVEQPDRRLYARDELIQLFAVDGLTDFGLSDQQGFQAQFIEMQLWDRTCISRLSGQCAFRLASLSS